MQTGATAASLRQEARSHGQSDPHWPGRGPGGGPGEGPGEGLGEGQRQSKPAAADRHCGAKRRSTRPLCRC